MVEPRAVTLDDESLRAFATSSLSSELEPLLLAGYGTRWYTGTGRKLAEVSANAMRFGYSCRNGFSQPELVALLAERVRNAPHGRVLFQTCLDGVEERPGRVIVRLSGDRGPATIVARYLVACDGANSAVRTRLGIALEGASHAQPWLIVDTVNSDDDARYSRFSCGDPRPSVAVPGRNGRMRYEFMLFPGEDPALVQEPEAVRALLASRGTVRDRDIVRVAVYRFHSRIAARWRLGRIFLAGDAAHLMPPFAGQGMNSGIRDAFNLAWKLALVCRGVASDRFLNSYEDERRPHVRAMLRMSQWIGRVVMSRGPLPSLARTILLGAAARIPGLRQYVAEMRFKPKARFTVGFVLRDGFDVPIVGTLAPNPLLLADDGLLHRFDAIAGAGFSLVAFDRGGTQRFPIAMAGLWHELDARFVLVLPGERTPQNDSEFTIAADIRGEFARALGPACDRVVLIRPDRIVAAAFRLEDLAHAEDALRMLLAGGKGLDPTNADLP